MGYITGTIGKSERNAKISWCKTMTCMVERMAQPHRKICWVSSYLIDKDCLPSAETTVNRKYMVFHSNQAIFLVGALKSKRLQN